MARSGASFGPNSPTCGTRCTPHVPEAREAVGAIATFLHEHLDEGLVKDLPAESYDPFHTAKLAITRNKRNP